MMPLDPSANACRLIGGPTFASALFGFVDDLEIRIDAEVGSIHLRSASRVGKSDLGANRKRVEIIQKLYREKQ
jgi:uncharacterized protein (DUF1499 family)